MAGIPPLAGFLAKYVIFISLAQHKFIFLLCLTLITSFVAIFNYLRIVKILLFQMVQQSKDVFIFFNVFSRTTSINYY